MVINLHREGPVAAATFQSVLNAQLHARAAGAPVEVILVLDRADPVTEQISRVAADRWKWKLCPINLGDLGEARNFGVDASRHDAIAFVDGDDLISENWLTAALKHLENTDRPTILHPDLCIFFGSDEHVLVHPDMSRGEVRLEDLLVENCWIALTVSTKKVFKEFPYWSNQLSASLGFEDWSWNIRTASAGVAHEAVPDTCHFIRRKRVSLLKQSVASNSIVKPVPVDLKRAQRGSIQR